VVINTVGPHWDGNQVWFITGGVPFLPPGRWCMPRRSVAFTGPCWWCCGLFSSARWALTTAAKFTTPLGAALWDWGLFIGGSVPPLIFGVAFGNLLQGVPFQFDAYLVSTYTGSFWQLLNPFALLAGVVSSAMITLQGGSYLAHRTEGVIQQRAIKVAIGAA
jgi:cytochrome d ubiquinol oxidase subunit II